MNNSSWSPLGRQEVGHRVAAPNPAGDRQTQRWCGTSNAAALTSKLAGEVILNLESDGLSVSDGVPPALLAKCVVAHSADWPEESALIVEEPPPGIPASMIKDHVSGLFGYGNVRRSRALGCEPDRATFVGGSVIREGTRLLHRVPLPSTLHAHAGWRRFTVTLAWFSPINPRSRKYRVANLSLSIPDPPLATVRTQVHAKATTRGTIQHWVMERESGGIDLPEDAYLEVFVNCVADGGPLTEPLDYALAISVETAPGTELRVYNETAARVLVPVRVRAQ